MKKLKFILSDLLLLLGIEIFLSPFILYWFIHGNYERYIWIINGPYPFSHFGGGPFQLFISVVLFIVGIGLIGISRTLKKKV